MNGFYSWFCTTPVECFQYMLQVRRVTKVKGFLNLVPYNTCGMLSIHASGTPGNHGEGFLQLVPYNTCGMLSIHASGTPVNLGEGFLNLVR